MPDLSEPTSDRVPTLQEIEAALAAATGGYWIAGRESSSGEWDVAALGKNAAGEGIGVVVARRPVKEADAHLIANAPSWLAYLLDRVKDREGEETDAICHYRNLAIELGAKPTDMLNKWDRMLCERWPEFREDDGGWWNDAPQQWEVAESAEAQIDALREALREIRGACAEARRALEPHDCADGSARPALAQETPEETQSPGLGG